MYTERETTLKNGGHYHGKICAGSFAGEQKNGDISAAQKILQQMEKRGLEIIVKKAGGN